MLVLVRCGGIVRYFGKVRVNDIIELKEKWKDVRDKYNVFDSLVEDMVLLLRYVWEIIDYGILSYFDFYCGWFIFCGILVKYGKFMKVGDMFYFFIDFRE